MIVSWPHFSQLKHFFPTLKTLVVTGFPDKTFSIFIGCPGTWGGLGLGCIGTGVCDDGRVGTAKGIAEWLLRYRQSISVNKARNLSSGTL